MKRYGQIVNISMEVEKNCGFITYDKVHFKLHCSTKAKLSVGFNQKLVALSKVESTERAIAEVNGSLVGGVQLKVTRIYHGFNF